MRDAVHAVSYDDTETRPDRLHGTIKQWLGDLQNLTDEARTTRQSHERQRRRAGSG